MTTRALKYPLYAPLNIEGASALLAPSILSLEGWGTLDNNEKVNVIFALSLSDFIRIASMIDVGRDIAYPDESEKSWDIWAGGLISMDLCDSVANCISTSESVQQSIETYLTSKSTTVKTIFDRLDKMQNQTYTADSSIVAPCDDKRFAGIVSMIDTLNTANIDALQVFSDSTRDVLERLEDASTIIPIIGDFLAFFGVDSALSFFSSIAQDVIDEYENIDTLTLREEIACGVFCRTDGCDVTLDDILDEFNSRIPSTTAELLNATLDEALAVLFGGTTLTNFYYYAVNILALNTLKSNNAWAGLTALRFSIAYTQGTQTPDSSHALLCDCGDVVEAFDFAQGQLNWFVRNGFDNAGNGEYITGQGWRYTDSTAVSGTNLIRGASIWYDIDNTRTVKALSVNYDFVLGVMTSNSVAIGIRLWDENDNMVYGEYIREQNTTDASNQVFVELPNMTASRLNVFVRCHNISAPAQQGNAFINSVTLTTDT